MHRGPTFIPFIANRAVDPDTIEPFAEGAWFAWRVSRAIDVDFEVYGKRLGIWWSDDGTRQLSVAVGDLHGADQLDWETYAVERRRDDTATGVCCHDSFEAAQACAVVFLATGRYCRPE